VLSGPPEGGAQPEAPAATPPAPTAGNPAAEVTLPSGRTLAVEVAETPLARQRGYMFRERVTDQEGMVFLMGEMDFHPFWMKNCRVSLDILWLDDGWKVVHLEQNVPPCRQDPCHNYTPMQAALYVLELQGGLASREGIRLGDRIIFKRPPGKP